MQNYANLTFQQKYDKTVYLSLKQKRLRHVTAIQATNLKIPSNVKKFSIWYTLHDINLKLIYISDTKQNDYNPKWHPINHSRIQHEHRTHKEFILRIWYANNENDSTSKLLNLLIQMQIHLDGLIQLNDEYLNDTKKLISNFIIFDIFNHHFSEPLNTANTITSSGRAKSNNMLQLQSLMLIPIQSEMQMLNQSLKLNNLNRIKFKQSYQLSLIMRLNDYEKVIFDTTNKIIKLKASIKQKFNETSRIRELKVKKEVYLQRLEMLHSEIDSKRIDISRLIVFNQQLEGRLISLKQSIRDLSKNIDLAKSLCKKVEQHNENLFLDLVNSKENLANKQKKLINNLAKIYFIENTSKKFLIRNSQRQQLQEFEVKLNELYLDASLKIVNIMLPSTNQYNNYDEQKINVALGYVCHCLVLLCSILNVPLRYPIKFNSSKSTIIDFSNDGNALISTSTSSGSSSSGGGANSVTNNIPTNNSSNVYTNGINGNIYDSNDYSYINEYSLFRINSTQEPNFSQAVFLLNKNLAQLRILFDHNYKNFDFTNTLGNLYWLLNQN